MQEGDRGRIVGVGFFGEVGSSGIDRNYWITWRFLREILWASEDCTGER